MDSTADASSRAYVEFPGDVAGCVRKNSILPIQQLFNKHVISVFNLEPIDDE
jgi:hypothetical protein